MTPQPAQLPLASEPCSTSSAEAARYPSVHSPNSATDDCTSKQSSPIPTAQRSCASRETAPTQFSSENPSATPCSNAAEMRSWKQSTGRELPCRSSHRKLCGAGASPAFLVQNSETQKGTYQSSTAR